MAKKPIKKTILPGGELLIESASGRRVRVPRDVIVFTPPSNFVENVRERVNDATRGMRACEVADFKAPRGGWWRMLYFITKRNVYVILEDSEGARRAGWAIFKREDGNVVESRAAIDPRFHGKGLYTLILKELRQWSGKRPLLSDQTLSIPNILTWSRVGTYSEKRNRYRHNPGPRRSLPRRTDYEKAILALYNRAYTA